MRRSLLLLLALCGSASLISATSVGLASAAPATTVGSACGKFAAPSGSDSAQGTQTAPYKTVQKLVGSLAAGQVGCLRAGTYNQDVTISRAQVTLTAYAGETANVVGRFWVKQGADGVVVSGLDLNGRNAALLPSPTVNGNDVQFVGNDVTNDHTEICFLIGSSWGRAQRTVLKGNRIHDCGKLPSSNQDHGIYVAEADDTQIVDNVIYDNVDRGVQLYPDAQRTVVRGNVIDGNGEGVIFSGDDGAASSHSVVEGNLITNSNVRANVESWYPSGNPVGVDNVVRGNCVSKAASRSAIDAAGGGFTATSNVSVTDPGYVDRAVGDFRVRSSSPCAAVAAASRAPAGLAWEAPVTSESGTTPPTTTPPPTTPTTTPPPTSTAPRATTPPVTPPTTTAPRTATPPATPSTTTAPRTATPPPATTAPRATRPTTAVPRSTQRTSTSRRTTSRSSSKTKAKASKSKTSRTASRRRTLRSARTTMARRCTAIERRWGMAACRSKRALHATRSAGGR